MPLVWASFNPRGVSVSGQGNYELARRLLNGMRRVREGIGEIALHAAYLDDLRNRHKAKRNFIKLLAARDA